MTAQNLELLALAVATMNGAFTPGTEAFIYKNCGKLREANGNLRSFSTVAGGLKSLIADLSRQSSNSVILCILRKYGCDSIEREFIVLDYLTQALGRTIEPSATLYTVDSI
jgi:hypothetical protein